MRRTPGLAALSVVLFMAFIPAQAQDTDELRDQRRAAQKERQLERNERGQAIKNATKAFREYVRELKVEYRNEVNDLETAFERKRVELRAQYDVKIAEAEAEYQQRLSGLLMKPGVQFDRATIEHLESEARAFSDQLFDLKKEAAEALYRERIANERRKNETLTEQDRLALEKASSLGLTQDYSPLLAAPLGDGLTPKEERWNERERKEVARLEDRNAKLLSEYTTGEAVRKWEIENLEEDFKLEWDEKSELHALESERDFLNALLGEAAQGAAFDRKAYAKRVADLTREGELIERRYKEIRDRNRIERREEKTKLLAY